MELPVKRVITYTSVYRAAQTELNMEKKKRTISKVYGNTKKNITQKTRRRHYKEMTLPMILEG